jgi:hypothetical protein
MAKKRKDRLLGVRIKIERAKHHIVDLESRIRIFRDAGPCEIHSEEDSETGAYVFKIKNVRPVAPDISGAVGDVIHNLRSALDHLAWGLVEANGSKPTKSTGFPIYESRAKYKAESLAKVKGMSKSAVDAIDVLKPYKRGNSDLWLLHNLDIIDKHRLLLACNVAQTLACITYFVPDNPFPYLNLVSSLTSPASDRLAIIKNGTELFRTIRAPKMNPEVQFIAEVAFGEPRSLRGRPVLPFLHQLAQFLDGIADRFAPLL